MQKKIDTTSQGTKKTAMLLDDSIATRYTRHREF